MTTRTLARVLRPARHLERHPAQHALLVLIGGVLAFGSLTGVASAAGFEVVLDRLRGLDPIWLPVALVAETVAYVGYTLAYREIARVRDGTDLGLRRAGAMVAAGFGVFVIRGGFVVDRQALESAGAGPREARIRVLGLGALEYALLAPATCGAAIFLLVNGDSRPGWALTLPWAIAVPLGFVAAFVALRFRRRVREEGRLSTALRHALDGIDVLRRLAMRPRAHGIAFAGAALYWVGDIACLWAALSVFGASPSVPALLIGYSTGYALTRRTLPLAGAGTVEAFVSFALFWAGTSLAPALLGVFAYRIFNLWLPLLPAAIGLRTLKQHAAEN